MTKMQTFLTSDDFEFLIAVLQDASLEIAEKQEEKQEELYDRIETDLPGVQQALHSSCVVYTTLREPELVDEPSQLHLLVDTVEARLRQA
jgi:hypothetical protein